MSSETATSSTEVTQVHEEKQGEEPREGNLSPDNNNEPIDLEKADTRSRREDGGDLRQTNSYYSGRQSFVDEDEEDAEPSPPQENVTEKPFEVQWDGDDDPMNPRNLKTWRKWIIVLTVSISSLCVYE